MTCAEDACHVDIGTPSKHLQIYAVILAQVFITYLCTRFRRHSHVPRDIERAICRNLRGQTVFRLLFLKSLLSSPIRNPLKSSSSDVRAYASSSDFATEWLDQGHTRRNMAVTAAPTNTFTFGPSPYSVNLLPWVCTATNADPT
jgi:hypothetical protein